MDSPLVKREELPSNDSAPDYGSTKENNTDELPVLYKRRWYILLLFCSSGFMQGMVWNTWGPIAQSALVILGWSKQNTVLFPIIGNVAFVLAIACAWIMDQKGLRVATLGASALLAIATGIRCISSNSFTLLLTSIIAAILNGAIGVVVYGGQSLISATWFPPHQRATATAIANMCVSLGVALSFIIGPQIVHFVNPHEICNITTNCSVNIHKGLDHIVSVDHEVKKQRKEIMHLMYTEFGLAAGLFLLILIYFPAKPPSPPSLTASIERVEFKKGIRVLATLPQFWMISLAYCIPIGTYQGWQAVWNFNMQPLGFSQTESGWIGFYSTIAFILVATVVSRLSDIFARHFKAILITSYVLSVASLLWCLLLFGKYINFNKASVYTAMILTGVFLNGGVPLFFEMACEVSYPVAEGVIGATLTCLNNAVGAFFLTILMIPHVGHRWMTWFMLFSVVAAIPLLAALQVSYTRLSLDTLPDKDSQKDTNKTSCGQK